MQTCFTLQNDGRPGEPDESDTGGWALAVKTLPGDTLIRKQGDDGFAGTQLDTAARRSAADC